MKRTPLIRRTPLRPQSPKRVAYRRSEAGKAGLAHMLRVKGLPCVCCGAPPPSDAHHCRSGGMARDDFKTISLCYEDHRGPKGYHADKANWEAKHGPDYGFLPRVAAMLAEQDGRTV